MGRYIARRLLYLILVLLIITFITYLIFYTLPTIDPAVAFAGKQPTDQIVKQVEKQFGLDKPWYQQYGLFVGRLVAGDDYGWPGLGFSFYTRSPIKGEIFDRALICIQVAIGAAIVWLLLGIPIGIVSALKRRTFVDRAAMGFALFGVSAPVFWLGLMGLFIFWEKLALLPGTGFTPFSENPGEWFGHLVMPWFCLALLFAAIYARLVRGQLIETMSEDYIRTARAKGLRERTVVAKHGLRASLTPVVSAFGVDFGSLLGGAIITETVFNIPGLGTYVIQAVRQGDLPTVLAVTVMAAFFITFMSLLVDIAYAYLDPRVRYS